EARRRGPLAARDTVSWHHGGRLGRGRGTAQPLEYPARAARPGLVFRRMTRRFAIVLLLVGCARPPEPAPSYEAEFRCPESYATEAEAGTAARELESRASQSHPDWTAERLTAYRRELLFDRGCGRYLCSEESGERHFALERSAGCEEFPI